MKTIYTHLMIASGVMAMITSSVIAQDDEETKIPTGTMWVEGNKVNYGERPTLNWTLNKPQEAKEVIEFLHPLDKATSTLLIKKDSTLKITVVGSQSYDHDGHRRVSVIRTRNGVSTKFPFFDGSSDNFNRVDYGSHTTKDEYWAVQEEDEDAWNQPRSGYPLFHCDYIWRYKKVGNSYHYTSSQYHGYYKVNGVIKPARKLTYHPIDNFELPVKQGDKIDFVSQFWSDYYRNCDTRHPARGLRDVGLNNEPGQKNIISLFGDDPIPTNEAAASNQVSALGLLQNYAKKGTIDGEEVWLANLAPNQMINLVDNNEKFRYNGTPSHAYDINDFIFLVTVGGQRVLNDNPNYDYYLVKMDRPAPVYELDDDGNPIIPVDANGVPITNVGIDDFSGLGSNFNGIYNFDDPDVIDSFDEIHKITDNDVPDDNGVFHYTFTTPNGRFGSDYKLIAIKKGAIIGGGDTEDTSDDVYANDSAMEVARLFLDSYNISYSLEIKDLVDQRSPMRLMGDGVNGVAIIKPDKTNTFNAKRKVFNLIAPPAPDASPDLLAISPKGAYSMHFAHHKFTYVDDATALTYSADNAQQPAGGMTETITEFGVEGKDDSLVFNGQLPTSEITQNGVFSMNNLTPVIESDKNGEEHFKTYAYLAIWGLENGTPKIVGYQKALVDDQKIFVWSPPSATLLITSPSATSYRKLPHFLATIKNIYPHGKIKIKVRPKNANPDSGVLIGSIFENGFDHAILEKTIEYVNPENTDLLGDQVIDGDMVIEVIHYVDYDEDGTDDDIRVLASVEWNLKRSIKVKGEINSSK